LYIFSLGNLPILRKNHSSRSGTVAAIIAGSNGSSGISQQLQKDITHFVGSLGQQLALAAACTCCNVWPAARMNTYVFCLLTPLLLLLLRVPPMSIYLTSWTFPPVPTTTLPRRPCWSAPARTEPARSAWWQVRGAAAIPQPLLCDSYCTCAIPVAYLNVLKTSGSCYFADMLKTRP
jgi:hypothetical protein